MVSGSKNDSRIKRGGKQKLVFAKDPQQALAAIIVVAIFIGNGIYMIVKNVMEQRASQAPVQQETAVNDPANPQSSGIQPPPGQDQQGLDELSNMGPAQTGPQDANAIYNETIRQQRGQGRSVNIPVEETKGADDVDILSKKRSMKNNGKLVSIAVSDSGRLNPFLPVNESVSSGSFAFLPPPPETLPQNTDASKVMSTTISGILYDKYSPSAIINIEGSDYLVKRGDVINHYKILSINKTQVVVQLGRNVYHAGVGELLTLANVNYNTIANLNKKFGGNDVSINVRKKGY